MTDIDMTKLSLPGLAELVRSPVAPAIIDHADLPWVDQGYGIEMKFLRIDRARGSWIIMNRFQPGCVLPTHRHGGPVVAITLAGRWRYLEHDWMAESGSVMLEPANSQHTLQIPADNTEPTIAIFLMEGNLVHIGPAGEFWGLSDGETELERYLAMADAQHLTVDRARIFGLGT